MKKTRNFTLQLTTILFFFISCNEPNEPVDLTRNVIGKDSEVFGLLQSILQRGDDPVENKVCIDFVYPFKLFTYDAALHPQGSVILNSDAQFSQFLNDLDPDLSISISYPIQTTFPDGTIFSVNNDQQLKIALDSCSREDIISYCNGQLVSQQGTCVWEIPYISGADNTFAGAAFSADFSGSISLYHHNTNFIGTWVFLFLNNELYLNINLSGTSSTAQKWNYNFKITTFTGDVFVIQTPSITRKLIKYCSSTTQYTIGQTGPNGGIIGYDKGSYTNGWRYIEVAPTDLLIEEWGCLNGEIEDAEFDQIGTGYQNTIAIANYHDTLTNYYLNPAICNILNNGSVSAKTALSQLIGIENDWFIPSVSELESIYDNLAPLNLGNFENTNYWSSSEFDVSNAKVLNFTNGEINNITKNNQTVKTRLIRYF